MRKHNNYLQNKQLKRELPDTSPSPINTSDWTAKEISEGMRLNKYIAKTGISSRRKADEFIKNGLVRVNDIVVREMGHRINTTDIVSYKKKTLEIEKKKIYILLNKPKNTISTASDEKGRRTVLDIVQNKVDVRIYPVGRLDRATVGLLLLTNDGALAQKLAHPKYLVQKVYHVFLDKPLNAEHLETIKSGFKLEDGNVEVDVIKYHDNENKNEVIVQIHIGRNRIVRRIFEHFEYNVKKLDRIYYAGLTKKHLARGKFRHLTEKEVIMLQHFT